MVDDCSYFVGSFLDFQFFCIKLQLNIKSQNMNAMFRMTRCYFHLHFTSIFFQQYYLPKNLEQKTDTQMIPKILDTLLAFTQTPSLCFISPHSYFVGDIDYMCLHNIKRVQQRKRRIYLNQSLNSTLTTTTEENKEGRIIFLFILFNCYYNFIFFIVSHKYCYLFQIVVGIDNLMI